MLKTLDLQAISNLSATLAIVTETAADTYRNQPFDDDWKYYSDIFDEQVKAAFPDFTLLGSGVSRRVYTFARIPDVVFKLEPSGRSNSREWELFHEITDSQTRRLLARALHLSDDGKVLAMEQIKGPRLADRQQKLAVRTRIRSKFEAQFKQEDFHGYNIMYCPSRKRYVAVDYAND